MKKSEISDTNLNLLMLFMVEEIAPLVCHLIYAKDFQLYHSYIYTNDFIANVSTSYDCWILCNEYQGALLSNDENNAIIRWSSKRV